MSRKRFIKSPFFCRFFDRRYLICEIPSSDREIFLTFDDGPIPGVTPAILDILKEKNAHATFFCLGANADSNPDILKRIVNEGHAVGNHTWHHLNGWKTPPAGYVEDVTRCETLFRTSLFRPPYGKFTPSQYFLLRKRYKFVLWSVLSHDYNSRVRPDECLGIALDNARPGSVVVFHDSIKAEANVLFALPRFLDHFLEIGYRFCILP